MLSFDHDYKNIPEHSIAKGEDLLPERINVLTVKKVQLFVIFRNSVLFTPFSMPSGPQCGLESVMNYEANTRRSRIYF